MPQRGHRRSRRLNNSATARRQRLLAEHLRDIEAQQILTNEPRKSLRLSAQRVPGSRYTLFGEDGYADPGDVASAACGPAI